MPPVTGKRKSDAPAPAPPVVKAAPTPKPKAKAKTVASSPAPTGRGSPWVVRNVLINFKEGPSEVKAEVYGSLAVYESLVKPGLFIVASSTVGYTLCRLRSKDDAKEVATTLWARACMALREKTQAGVRDKLPEWVKDWLHECEKVAVWINPIPYAKAKPEES